VHTTKVNGLAIAYERAGEGPPVVLLHGFLSDSRAWRSQIAEFSSDFTVIAWDAPGCGRSSDPAEEFSMAAFADCLAELLHQLGIGPAHICGLSWGGTCALGFYRRHPGSVRSLILADTYAGWTGSLGGDSGEQRLALCLRQSELPPEQWVHDFLRGAVADDAPAAIRDELAAIVSDFHPVGFRAMSRAVTPDFSAILPLIRLPTLLIWGEDDKRSPLSVAEQFHIAIAGSTLVVIPDAGHVSNMEQPARFNTAVREFLKSLESRA
jgi:pimeloyl-ACP methyl ester carboxylesterase